MQTLPPEVSAPRIPTGAPRGSQREVETRRLVAEVAYSLGARRGFEGGLEQAFHDWIEAEKIVAKRARGQAEFRI